MLRYPKEDYENPEIIDLCCTYSFVYLAISLVSALILGVVFNLPIYISILPNAALCVFCALGFLGARGKLLEISDAKNDDDNQK